MQACHENCWHYSALRSIAISSIIGEKLKVPSYPDNNQNLMLLIRPFDTVNEILSTHVGQK